MGCLHGGDSENALTSARSNSAIERVSYFLTPLTYETLPGPLLTGNKMKISSIRHVRSRCKDFARRMQNPSVVSNGTKVGEDKTEVLAGSREALCLPIDLGGAFRFRLRNAPAVSDQSLERRRYLSADRLVYFLLAVQRPAHECPVCGGLPITPLARAPCFPLVKLGEYWLDSDS